MIVLETKAAQAVVTLGQLIYTFSVKNKLKLFFSVSIQSFNVYFCLLKMVFINFAMICYI